MKKLFICVLLTIFFFSCSSENPGGNSGKKYKVGITQIVSHPSLDDVRYGVIEGLNKSGFSENDNLEIIFRNANGDPSLTLPIAQEFVRDKVDVIVPITTPSALGALKSTRTIPIVFGGVTDPVGVGLVENIMKPGGNITGTSDQWPFAEQFRLFKQLLPSMKKMGIMYQPGDDVAAFGISKIKEVAAPLNVELKIRPVSNSSEVYITAINLFKEVDSLFTGMDNLTVENFDSVLKAAYESQKPIFAGDVGTVQRGAVATVSVHMKDLGVLTGKIVAEVLNGSHPSNIPIKIITKGVIYVNRIAMEKFGLDSNNIKDLDVTYVDAQ